MAAVRADGLQHLHNERIGTVISQIRVHDRIGRPPLTEGHPARKREPRQVPPPVFCTWADRWRTPRFLPHCCHVEAEQRSTPAPTGSFL